MRAVPCRHGTSHPCGVTRGGKTTAAPQHQTSEHETSQHALLQSAEPPWEKTYNTQAGTPWSRTRAVSGDVDASDEDAGVDRGFCQGQHLGIAALLCIDAQESANRLHNPHQHLPVRSRSNAQTPRPATATSSAKAVQ